MFHPVIIVPSRPPNLSLRRCCQ